MPAKSPAPQGADLSVYRLFIEGRFVDSCSGRFFETANPYSLAPWARIANATTEDVDTAVAAARTALDGEWGAMTGFQRAALLRKLAELVERDAEKLARIEVRDSGKLFREMLYQMSMLRDWLNYFAGFADKLEGKTIPTDKPNFLVYTTREPVGVVAAITPWNAPLMLMIYKLAPALAAGCTIVIKPSELAPASTLVFAELVREAGFPAGVVNVVTGDERAIGAHLAGHPGIDKVTFTGSTETGRAVAKAAGQNLNGVMLELGGKSPQVVFGDADIEAAANGVIAGIFAAAGQTCMAGSRLIVHRSIRDALVERVVARAREIRLGDPQAAETEMGPISNQPQYDRIMGFLRSAAEEGATIAYGGADPDLGGLFVRPTVITDVTPSMRVVREEVFGPVLSVLSFEDEAEALNLANQTEYGLAGSVWTMNIQLAHRMAHKMHAGTVWINSYRALAASVPFGGFGSSGIGRENGIECVHAFTETKSIWVELTGATRDPFRMV
ncbi:MAG: aldehyde dehydrogenase [Qingshengfaniella sp.]